MKHLFMTAYYRQMNFQWTTSKSMRKPFQKKKNSRLPGQNYGWWDEIIWITILWFIKSKTFILEIKNWALSYLENSKEWIKHTVPTMAWQRVFNVFSSQKET